MDLTQPPWPEIYEILTGPVLRIAIIVVVAWFVLRTIDRIIAGLVRTALEREAKEGTTGGVSPAELEKREQTLTSFSGNVVRGFVLVIAGLMILGELGVDIGPAIAGLGVVGIAVGFGAQSLVRDYFTGVLILLENQFSVGDVIGVAGVSGTVELIGLRRTVVRDLDGVVHTVPNGEITVASNKTRLWARINEDVQVAYGSDLDQVTAIVAEVGREMAESPEWHDRVLEPVQVLRVQSFDESGVTLKLLGSIRAGDQWAAAGDLRRRLLDAFDRNGIEIPYPHRVILSSAAPGSGDGAGPDVGAGGDGPDRATTSEPADPTAAVD